MYKLEFKLKQHTPLIHFQHEQHGATLRATELKPKLDKFLITKFKEQNTDYKNWLIKGQEKALDYKVKIQSSYDLNYFYFESYIKATDKLKVQKFLMKELNLPNLKVVAPSPYFANNDKRNNGQFDEMNIALLENKPIVIELKTFKNGLLEKIENHLQEFFIIHNFGNRQSKGFGSFTLENTDKAEFEKNLKKNFSFFKLVKKENDVEKTFKTIDKTYKNLKNNAATKVSKIKEFYQTKNIEWEKDYITKEVINNQRYKSDKEIKYVRALLGLAELHDYPQTQPPKKVKIKHLGNDDKNIERFQSPLTFKVFNNSIYIVANESNIGEILGEWFVFYIDKVPKDSKKQKKLQVPSKFSIVEFLNQKL